MTDFLNSIGINSGMFTSAVITIVLCVLSIIAGRKMEMVPHGLQNVAEVSIEKLYGFFEGIMGPRLCKKYFPLVATFFIYILFCNYSGLLPASGHVPGLSASTATVNCTLALAIITFIAVQVIGVREHHGFSFYKHLIQPFAFLLPLMIVEDLVKPVSLTLRLYGNTYGDETVVASIFNMIPIGVPVIMEFLSVLMCLVQAVVFSLLSAIYIAEAGEIEGEL